MKKRYTEEQIISFLQEAEAGMAVKDLCRKHGFSEASYYLWKSKFGGMSVPEAKRLKELDAENARLKKLLAESLLENEIIKEALRKSGERTGSLRTGVPSEDARLERAACFALTRILDRLAVSRGLPQAIRTDNGKEFCGRAMLAWAHERGVRLFLIEPVKPNQNAYIESFNGRFRDECLNENWFMNLLHARALIGQWQREYNEERPKKALKGLTPKEYAQQLAVKAVNLSPDSNSPCTEKWGDVAGDELLAVAGSDLRAEGWPPGVEIRLV